MPLRKLYHDRPLSGPHPTLKLLKRPFDRQWHSLKIVSMDDNEIVTRGILRTVLAAELSAALAVAFDNVALIIGASFQRLEDSLKTDIRALEERVDNIERHLV